MNLRHHVCRFTTGEQDLPDDRFNDHVNNARYFHFVNLAFRSWYVAMGIRGGVPGYTAYMAHIELDFLAEIKPPAMIECRLTVDRTGKSSLTHTIEIVNIGNDGTAPPVVAARGHAVHVWYNRTLKRSEPWPLESLARCTAPA